MPASQQAAEISLFRIGESVFRRARLGNALRWSGFFLFAVSLGGLGLMDEMDGMDGMDRMDRMDGMDGMDGWGVRTDPGSCVRLVGGRRKSRRGLPQSKG